MYQALRQAHFTHYFIYFSQQPYVIFFFFTDDT